MSATERKEAAIATELSSALKDLHRALIRAEVGDDPVLGNPYTMLFALISNPRFAWMTGLSDLIVRIDHQVAEDEINADRLRSHKAEAAAFIGHGEGQSDPEFRLRHISALQTHPEVGFATGKLRRILLGSGRDES